MDFPKIGTHIHGVDCGHTIVKHKDHKGYIVDGSLHCLVSKENFNGDSPENQNVMGQNTFVMHNIEGIHPIACSEDKANQSPGKNVQNDPKMDQAKQNCHDHHSGCGHEAVTHEDHQDYLVNGVLHHPHDDHCDEHNAVGIEDETIIISTLMRNRDAKVKRRHEINIEEFYDSKHKKKDWKTIKFLIMIFLTVTFFIVELVFSFIYRNMSLFADSMHMLNDLFALLIGFYCLRRSRISRTDKATFGLIRMEVVGGLINSSFLIAVSLGIAMEAIVKIVNMSINKNDTHDWPKEGNAILIVAGIGLAINVIGLFMFGHSHVGHSHSEDEVHKSTESNSKQDKSQKGKKETIDLGQNENKIKNKNGKNETKNKTKIKKNKNQYDLNIRSVFLHVLGDALGSVAVIISGLIINARSIKNRHYSDPVTSLIISIIIFATTIPTMKHIVLVLLEKVPKNIKLEELLERLLEVDGVLDVHELHIWPLNMKKVMGYCHVIFKEGDDFLKATEELKKVFHKFGVHSTSIQPEFHYSALKEKYGKILKGQNPCFDMICEEKNCVENACCAPVKLNKKNMGEEI